MTDPVPAHVRQLLEGHIDSVSQLELLVLLVREQRPWRSQEIAAVMVLTVEHVDGLLASLARAGLLEGDGKTYLFRPSDQSAKRAAEDLARIYQTYRLRITNIVFTKPNDRV